MYKCEPVETQSPFYYSIEGAKNRFGLTTNEIFDLAIKGKIILSVNISNEYKSYFMSTVEPKNSKIFRATLYMEEELKDKSMLPQEVNATHLNLSKDECKVLKTSNLIQSVFESVFCKLSHSHSEHKLLHFNEDWINDIKLDFDNARLEELQDNDSLKQLAEIANQVTKI